MGGLRRLDGPTARRGEIRTIRRMRKVKNAKKEEDEAPKRDSPKVMEQAEATMVEEIGSAPSLRSNGR